MQVTVDSVLVENKGKYKMAVVNYNSGKKQNVVSFGPGAEVFLAMASATEGSNWDITTAPNQRDSKYTDWVKAVPVNASSKPSTEAKGTRTSTYETPEERAQRQVYIIRQSSLERALDYNSLMGNKKVSTDEIISMADYFASYVLNGRKIDSEAHARQAMLDTYDEDVPF